MGGGGGGGGDKESQMKLIGVIVGNFERNPYSMGRQTSQYCIFISMVNLTFYMVNLTFYMLNY